MTLILTRAQVREVDRRAIEEFGMPGALLMENAGGKTAELLRAQEVLGSVLVCCGKGNNGGDGFVIARHLDNRGLAVKVALFAAAEEIQGDARLNLNILLRSGVAVAEYGTSRVDFDGFQADLDDAEWVVDALYGTGLTDPPRHPFDQVIDRINDSQARVFAVDVPSGLDCDTGLPLGVAIKASHTATFVGMKRGFTNPDAEEYTGEVHVVDIGAPRRAIEAALGG